MIVHGITRGIPSAITQEINLLRYAERRHLTYQEALDEPNEVVQRFFLLWELDRARDKLNENTN